MTNAIMDVGEGERLVTAAESEMYFNYLDIHMEGPQIARNRYTMGSSLSLFSSNQRTSYPPLEMVVGPLLLLLYSQKPGTVNSLE